MTSRLWGFHTHTRMTDNPPVSRACAAMAQEELVKILDHLAERPMPVWQWTPEDAVQRWARMERKVDNDSSNDGAKVSTWNSDELDGELREALEKRNPVFALRSAGNGPQHFVTPRPVVLGGREVTLCVTSNWVPKANLLYAHMTFKEIDATCEDPELLSAAVVGTTSDLQKQENPRSRKRQRTKA